MSGTPLMKATPISTTSREKVDFLRLLNLHKKAKDISRAHSEEILDTNSLGPDYCHFIDNYPVVD